MKYTEELKKIRIRSKELGWPSWTSEQYQDDIFSFILDNQTQGKGIIEVGCCKGGLSAQLAFACAILQSPLYLIDIEPEYIEITKEHLKHLDCLPETVIYYTGTFEQFAQETPLKDSPLLVIIHGDHRDEGVVNDIKPLFRLPKIPYAAAFHGFNVQNKNIPVERVAQVIYDCFGPEIHMKKIGEQFEENTSLNMSSSKKGYYAELYGTEGAIIAPVVQPLQEMQLEALCPFCNTVIPLNQPISDKPCEHSEFKQGILCLGAGYAESIVEAHDCCLNTPEKVDQRKKWEIHFVNWCVDLFKMYSAKEHTPPSQIRVLSLGCGVAFDVMRFIELGYDAYGVDTADLSASWLHYHGKELAKRCVLSSTGDLPYREQTFDLIVSMNVLEHVGTIPPQELVTAETYAKRQAFIQGAVSRLKPGGIFLLVAPNKLYPFDRGHSHYYMPYTAKMFATLDYTLTNPFSGKNFLPGIREIKQMCQAIAVKYPLTVVFKQDRSLFGVSPGPRPGSLFSWKDKVYWLKERFKNCIPSSCLTRALLPHIQAIIKREL